MFENPFPGIYSTSFIKGPDLFSFSFLKMWLNIFSFCFFTSIFQNYLNMSLLDYVKIEQDNEWETSSFRIMSKENSNNAQIDKVATQSSSQLVSTISFNSDLDLGFFSCFQKQIMLLLPVGILNILSLHMFSKENLSYLLKFNKLNFFTNSSCRKMKIVDKIEIYCVMGISDHVSRLVSNNFH